MKVVVFGAFDPLHEGHIDMFRQASKLANYELVKLLVIVARDSSIYYLKHGESKMSEEKRLKLVSEVKYVDEAVLGDQWPSEDQYRLLGELDFDVVALGYDQDPSDVVVRKELDNRGKDHVKIIRLKPYKPEQYKSSLLREES